MVARVSPGLFNDKREENARALSAMHKFIYE